MVLLTFVWKCFQDRNFQGVVVGLYEQSIESWVGLPYTARHTSQKFPQTGEIIDFGNISQPGENLPFVVV